MDMQKWRAAGQALAAALLLPAVSQATEQPQVAVVHQLIDPSAQVVAEVFRFEPKFLRVPAGATVRFKGSVGRHTVSSIRAMIPEGARSFEIRGKPEMELTFEHEGVYGIRCRVHGRHGMVMLLVVGDPGVNITTARAYLPELPDPEREVFEELFNELERTDG
ncbi:pseudoazurin [Ruegeria intermedia]|uniref:Pseudoazurin n=1 Tax=Ruegeria intermedia TaxID=996115 RepID=A0A1M4ZR12_9RHOB|nr:plastocyanin/azurin family copper-binding protein [Ruegeria intermedia]SHF20232.1 pseudoazurin [Ruegeria intermedia]